MAGLNELVTNKETTTSTMPAWYESAQQQATTSALGAASPNVQDTAAQTAIQAFAPGASPFAAGQTALQSIASGAANPWMVSDTGEVTPDVSTPMGGLFQAQQDYFKQIMPDIAAQQDASAISGGGFGSKMNLAGVARETGKAYSDLAQKQMQSALQNQQAGVAAGAGLGGLGNQMVQAALNTGTYQQNAPYASALNLANVLSKMPQEATREKSVELGGLNQIMGLLAATEGGLGSLTGTSRIDPKTGQKISTPGLIEQIKALYGQVTGGSQPSLGGFEQILAPEGEDYGGWDYFYDPGTGSSVTISPTGDYYQDGQLIWSNYNYDPTETSSGLDTSGSDTSWLDDFDYLNDDGGFSDSGDYYDF
jgi:hypothetical protein